MLLWAVVMRLSLPATFLPPPAAAQGRKRKRASQTDDRGQRRGSRKAVLTVAAYTKP